MNFYKRGLLMFVHALLLVCVLYASSGPDAVENLIDNERERREVWESNAESQMPPVFMLGDKMGAELYAASTAHGEPNGLCDTVNFDELVDLSLAPPDQSEIPLNASLPRIKEIISSSCLIRPGDRFVAITSGQNHVVEVGSFVLRKEKPLCPEDRGYSLWALFKTPLDTDPLLISTDVDLHEGENYYSVITAADQGPLEKSDVGKLSSDISLIDDYDITRYKVPTFKQKKVLLFSRHNVSLDDIGLPNAFILSQTTMTIQTLATVTVKRNEKSGHLSLGAVLDYNQDGITDLWILGDDRGCPFRLLFQGTADGFYRVETPNKPCAC